MRASRRASSALPKCSPGVVTDTIAACVPALSMSSIEPCTVHCCMQGCIGFFFIISAL
jgi:hypothetical protein